MKKLIVATVIAACLILCAAVWPQSEAVEEVPATPPPSVVASQYEMLEALEIEELIVPEKEKVEIPTSKMAYDIIGEPEPTPDQTPIIPEDDSASEEVSMDSKVQPTPEPTPTLTPSQAAIDPQPGDMVYVPGFGWLECHGPGEVIHDKNIYESGNKVGSMG